MLVEQAAAADEGDEAEGWLAAMVAACDRCPRRVGAGSTPPLSEQVGNHVAAAAAAEEEGGATVPATPPPSCSTAMAAPAAGVAGGAAAAAAAPMEAIVNHLTVGAGVRVHGLPGDPNSGCCECCRALRPPSGPAVPCSHLTRGIVPAPPLGSLPHLLPAPDIINRGCQGGERGGSPVRYQYGCAWR
jgi:hypothetical protein